MIEAKRNEKMKLDVGCGASGSIWEGFIGVDKYNPPQYPRKKNTTYIQMDFVYQVDLPWPDNTFDEIICFHVIEHMNTQEGKILMARIFRILKPGCKAYIVCPDLDIFAKKLIEKDHKFFDSRYPKNNKPMWPGDTLAEKFCNQLLDGKSYGHKGQGYNYERLAHVAREAGFLHIEKMPKSHRYHCDPSRIDHEFGIIATK